MELKHNQMLYFLIIANFFVVAALAQGGGSAGGSSGTGTVNSSQPVISKLSSQFCSIVNDVRDVIGILALAMFLVGAILYAGGNFLPAAGNLKSSTQGWAMGMIIGGAIGIVLVIIAPYILSIIISFSNGTVPAISC